MPDIRKNDVITDEYGRTALVTDVAEFDTLIRVEYDVDESRWLDKNLSISTVTRNGEQIF